LFSKTCFFCASAILSGSKDTYAPLPDFFPVGSTEIFLSLSTTTRTNSFFGCIVFVNKSLRIGIFLFFKERHLYFIFFLIFILFFLNILSFRSLFALLVICFLC